VDFYHLFREPPLPDSARDQPKGDVRREQPAIPSFCKRRSPSLGDRANTFLWAAQLWRNRICSPWKPPPHSLFKYRSVYRASPSTRRGLKVSSVWAVDLRRWRTGWWMRIPGEATKTSSVALKVRARSPAVSLAVVSWHRLRCEATVIRRQRSLQSDGWLRRT